MYKLTKAEPRHAPQMHEIESECFPLPWSEVSLKYEILKPTSHVYIMGDGEYIAAHAYMWHILNEGQICNIVVRPKCRRAGLASALLEKLILTGEELEMIGLTLEVRESNTAAISLYKKYGFKTEGVRKNYYANPTENGLVMWRYYG